MSFVRTYDTATAPRGFLRHVLPLLGYPALVWRYRYMIHNFFWRELLNRWHGSLLGAGWMLAQPLFLFCIYYFIFGTLFGERGTGKNPEASFALYLFAGVIVFHALVEAVSTCVSVISANGNLVKKVAFPSETLVVPTTMISLVIYAVGGLVCLILGTSLGVLQPGWMLLTLPLILIVQAIFTAGFGLFLANLNVFMPDIGQLWRVISMAWMFLTPIFWMPDRLIALEEKGIGWVGDVAQYGNPAYSLVMCHRLALGGQNDYARDAEGNVTDMLILGEFWPQFGVLSAWAVFFLVLGYASFTANKHKYADLI
ncbi:MAG: ABC transporter permease [bacterium]|nr:ABC transporter permease [bacterium]